MKNKGRPEGIFNCPFKVGYGVCYCKLDDKKCTTYFAGLVFWCRGWLQNGKPSDLQVSYLQQDDFFRN